MATPKSDPVILDHDGRRIRVGAIATVRMRPGTSGEVVGFKVVGEREGGDNATAHWVKIQLSTDGPFAASATILMPSIDLVVEDEGGD